MHVLTDPVAVERLLRPLIAADPAGLTVLGSVLAQAVRPDSPYAGARWLVVRRGVEVVAAAAHTPPHPPYVGSSDPEVHRILADWLATHADSGPPVSAVRGPTPAVEAFAAQWLTHSPELTATIETASRLFSLTGPPALPHPVNGSARQAGADEVGLVNRWQLDFLHAIGEQHPVPMDFGPDVQDGRCFFWEVDGQLVSCAFRRATVAGVSRVAGVFTPPDQRRHGYAGALVAHISEQIQGGGGIPVLYTDLANPTSNKLYREIGYRPIRDEATVSFVPR